MNLISLGFGWVGACSDESLFNAANLTVSKDPWLSPYFAVTYPETSSG